MTIDEAVRDAVKEHGIDVVRLLDDLRDAPAILREYLLLGLLDRTVVGPVSFSADSDAEFVPGRYTCFTREPPLPSPSCSNRPLTLRTADFPSVAGVCANGGEGEAREWDLNSGSTTTTRFSQSSGRRLGSPIP